jgi:hypothetical protein
MPLPAAMLKCAKIIAWFRKNEQANRVAFHFLKLYRDNNVTSINIKVKFCTFSRLLLCVKSWYDRKRL